MLHIKSGTFEGTWHQGTVMRVPTGRVITFQADGHELAVILDALEKAGIEVVRCPRPRSPILPRVCNQPPAPEEIIL